MNIPVFTPETAEKRSTKPVSDRTSVALIKVAQCILFGSIVLAVLAFFPNIPGLQGVAKTYILLFGVISALIFFSLGVLRNGSIRFLVPYTLIAWFAVIVSSTVASLLAVNPVYSLVGTVLGVHTTGFLLLLAVIMACSALFAVSRTALVYIYSLFFLAGVILIGHHILRIFFGSEIANFGFLGPTGSVFGSFNDLGLFLGVFIMVVIIALEQLRSNTLLKAVGSTAVVLALIPLAVINFSFVWISLGFFSLVLVMYTLTKDRFAAYSTSVSDSNSHRPTSVVSVALIAVVFITSAVFVVGGDALGSRISEATNTSYIEVRPSFTATLGVAQNVYETNAITGIGPNNFVQAWRLHKDTSINETIFWDTEFNGGSGYVPTWFVTSGLLGGLTWLVFLGIFTWSGCHMLLRSKTTSVYWFFFGTASFVIAAYLWLATLLYMPGPLTLALAALFTGLTLAIKQVLVPQAGTHINLVTSARSGLILIILVMVVIISTVAVGYGAARQLAAAYTFSTIPADLIESADINAINERIASSYQLFSSDVYVREISLIYQLRLNQLIALESPTEVEQQEFEQIITQAISAAEQAVSIDATNPVNWLALGDIYNVLAAIEIEGAADRAIEVYEEAKRVDPKNPVYAILQAIAASRNEQSDVSRTYVAEALRLKSNYSDAIFFLTQLDISEGNIDEAVANTRALISLEPNNAGRYYQLGVLLAEQANRDAAIQALSRAIEINPNYSNARYVRAIQYFEQGDAELAISELEAVQALNPDNESINTLIEQMRSGEIDTTAPTGQLISEPSGVSTDNDVTTSQSASDTDLITPVNFGGANETSENPPSTAGNETSTTDTPAE